MRLEGWAKPHICFENTRIDPGFSSAAIFRGVWRRRWHLAGRASRDGRTCPLVRDTFRFGWSIGAARIERSSMGSLLARALQIRADHHRPDDVSRQIGAQHRRSARMRRTGSWTELSARDREHGRIERGGHPSAIDRAFSHP